MHHFFPPRSTLLPVFVASVLAWHGLTGPSWAKGPTYADPGKTDQDFAYQGEYAGELRAGEGESLKIGVQVIALGQGKFRAVGHLGGLPGDGWNGEERHELEGELKDGVVRFQTDDTTAEIRDGTMKIMHADGTSVGDLPRVHRVSSTMGDKPPADAIVLFDGKNADAWKNGRVTDDGLLMEGVTSNRTFGSHKLHIEFRLPYMPEARGQARGNGGIYVQGRYEVQMLDSFGLKGADNECGGIYTVKSPSVNMCYPPLTWQTYDIEFTAAKYDEQGKAVANPRMTVYHNNVKIHDNVEIPDAKPTRAAPVKAGVAPGPVFLQNHGNPLRYRNIWVVDTK